MKKGTINHCLSFDHNRLVVINVSMIEKNGKDPQKNKITWKKHSLTFYKLSKIFLHTEKKKIKDIEELESL